MYTTDTSDGEYGSAISIDNFFDGECHDDSDGVGFTVTDYYLYDFFMDPAENVPTVVEPGVGPAVQYGEIGLMPIPGQGAVGVSNSTLSWKTGTHSPTSYVVYFGTTTSPTQVAAISETSYDVGPLSSGVVYYWRVDQVTASSTIPGKLWAFRAQ